MFDFDFEDLWDTQTEEALVGTWAYVGRQGHTTYTVSRTEAGRLVFTGPSAAGVKLSGSLQPVKLRSVQAELCNQAGEAAGCIRLTLSEDGKAVVSTFRVAGKETWGQDILSHRVVEDAGAGTDKPKANPAEEARQQKQQPALPENLPQSVWDDTEWKKDLHKPPAIHDLKRASTSQYAEQMSELSRDVFGINLLIGLDQTLKAGTANLSVIAKGAILVGFVLFSKEEKKGEIRVHYLVVHGSFRGNGAGCSLLRHLQELCRKEGIQRMVATCRYDQVFYMLRVGFYFSVQPPPNLHSVSAEVTGRLHHIRFGVEHPLGRPASGLLGHPPAKQPLPTSASGWSALEKEFFQRTHGKYTVEDMAKLRREPAAGRVSIVIPTMEKRQEFHEQFCACFEAQDWPDTELVVVDTYHRFASPAVANLARRLGKRVIHVKFQTDLTIGLKRNMGVHLATGQYIVHFDDDDLYAPGYVTAMIQHLRHQNLKAVTLCSWYNCATHSGEVSYTDPVDGTWGYEGIVYGFGFSYAYYREVALEHPFPHVSLSEDNQFMSKLRRTFGEGRGGVGLLRDKDGICLHLLHGNNTSPCGSHRDVSPQEAAGMQVCRLHKLVHRVDSKGLRALSHLVWSQRGLDKEEAKHLLSCLRRFLTQASVRSQVTIWQKRESPTELQRRVSELLGREVYPKIFEELGLPLESGLQIALGSLETHFRDDAEIVEAWRDVHQLQGNQEATEKINRHLLALRSRRGLTETQDEPSLL